MNNTDITYIMNLLNNMDKNQLSTGLEKINKILSPEEKNKLIQILNSKGNI